MDSVAGVDRHAERWVGYRYMSIAFYAFVAKLRVIRRWNMNEKQDVLIYDRIVRGRGF
jgi:hypothetical protein